ncbi:MAG: hypothetical protein AVDCRST_MAG14-2000, partial [uncultured Rubrobacteraceae bacterium]
DGPGESGGVSRLRRGRLYAIIGAEQMVLDFESMELDL